MAFIRVLLFLLPFTTSSSYKENTGTYRAAVYEHEVFIPWNILTPVSRQTALNNMVINLNVYKQQAEKAGQQEADILVFPEDGIYGPGFSRDAITPYLEYIPDPTKIIWNPCQDPGRFQKTEVQTFLSCLSKNNSLYIVANFGDIQPCNTTVDVNCPDSGHYQYNTDLVYDPKGQLIAKYHKINLFYEDQFDKPEVQSPVFFDTPFGTFGVFTCFDILFYNPAAALFILYNAGNVVFPTAWRDALPLLSSIEFHSAFARGMGINLLAANIHFPLLRFHGSGIYTPNGVASYTYRKGGKLLISDIPTVDKPSYREPNVSFEGEYFPTDIFTSVVFHDEFKFVPVVNRSGILRVCSDIICCKLEYSMEAKTSDLYAFGAFSGLHTYQGSYFIQVCALIKCKTSSHSSCGQPTETASTKFNFLKIMGNLSTPFIFPEILLSDSGSLALSGNKTWIYDRGTLQTLSPLEHPVLTAGLFARVYEPWVNGADTRTLSDSITTCMFVLCVYSTVFSLIVAVL